MKKFISEICDAIKFYNASDSLWRYRKERIPLEVKKFVCYKHFQSIDKFDLWAKRYCEVSMPEFSKLIHDELYGNVA